MTLVIRPCTLKEANALVETLHRHHKPCVGHRFSLACYDDDDLCGIVICGRPVSRGCDPYLTLEISRCATNGTKNAISKLYGAVCKAAKAMGYLKVQTYTLPEEGGASMRASGFNLVAETAGGQWAHTDGKQRRTDQPISIKHRWERTL
jgi:hypothetical protein